MSELHAVLDRIRGAVAVLFFGSEQHQVVVPRGLLPLNAEEGVALRISVDVDFAATEEAKRRTRNYIYRLSTGEG